MDSDGDNDGCPAVPRSKAHRVAMAAHAALSQTQFGRAALDRHGHNAMSVEVARAYQSKDAKHKG